MQEVFEKIIEKLEELKKCGTKHYEDGEYIYTSPDYDHETLNKTIKIVKQEAEQYEECYKDYGDCEAYDKEKHHCPKFCKVIKETVKEIEENHNGWIPCSERLPEENSNVIACFAHGAVTELAFYGGLFHGIYDYNTNVIIAWQPFPAPYQQKGE